MKKQLKFKFDLSSKVSIYVPSTTNVSEQTDNTEQVRKVMSKLSEMFGGATASEAVGGWMSQTAGLVLEKVTIVYAFCKETDLQNNIGEVLAICEDLKKEMQQEAISLEINGQLSFI